MEPPGGRDSRFNLGYSMNLLSGETPPEIYGNPGLTRPSTSLQQLSPRHSMVTGCGGNRNNNNNNNNNNNSGGMKSGDICYDERGMPAQNLGGLEACGGVNDINDDAYTTMQPKKSPPSNGKKTKGRVKIKMEYIENKLRRYTTFSKRKTGIMKKAYELSTLTGTQVMLLVASETGHVYTFATRKLQPMITSEAGKALIQTCLNSPDPPAGSASGDQRMSATGFEETELTYNISDDDSKDENMSGGDSSESSEGEVHDEETDVIFLPSSKSTTPPISSLSSSSSTTTNSSSTTTTTSTVLPSSTSSSSSVQQSTSTTTASTTASIKSSSSSSSIQQPPILSPLVYQTPQGMMYATPSNGGVIFSLAQTDPNSTHPPQFITIPLSMVTANGQGELDLSSKRK